MSPPSVYGPCRHGVHCGCGSGSRTCGVPAGVGEFLRWRSGSVPLPPGRFRSTGREHMGALPPHLWRKIAPYGPLVNGLVRFLEHRAVSRGAETPERVVARNPTTTAPATGGRARQSVVERCRVVCAARRARRPPRAHRPKTRTEDAHRGVGAGSCWSDRRSRPAPAWAVRPSAVRPPPRKMVSHHVRRWTRGRDRCGTLWGAGCHTLGCRAQVISR